MLLTHRPYYGIFWFGTDGSVSRYDGKELVHVPTVMDWFRDIFRDRNSIMWVGANMDLSRDDAGVDIFFKPVNKLACNFRTNEKL